MYGMDQYTKLLIPGRGVNNSTNIIDMCGKTITVNDGAKISTAQSKFSCYGSSIYFDGAGDALVTPGVSDFAFPGDFTIDTYVYFTNILGNTQEVILSCFNGNTNWIFELYNGKFDFYISGFNPASVGPSLNTWYHFAVVRNGIRIDLYVDGVSVLNFNDTTSISAGSYLVVGAHSYNGSSIQLPMTGYQSNVRISKGIARWTSNFTPPARPYGMGGFGFMR